MRDLSGAASDTQTAQPVLGYATPEADGLPDWVPEAEEQIERGRSPNAIRRYFPSSKQAVRYFAKSMARRYGPEAMGSACLGCGTDGQLYAIQLQWLATADLRFLEFQVSGSNPTAEIKTIHPVCERCLGEWHHSITRYNRPVRWLSWGYFAALALFALFFVGPAIPMLRSYVGGPSRPFRLLWLAPLAMVTVLRQTFVVLWRWRLPRPVKRLMHREVRLIAISAVFVRENGTVRSLTT
jgi:hypothetical protein